jgi:hypothetical protein
MHIENEEKKLKLNFHEPRTYLNELKRLASFNSLGSLNHSALLSLFLHSCWSLRRVKTPGRLQPGNC